MDNVRHPEEDAIVESSGIAYNYCNLIVDVPLEIEPSAVRVRISNDTGMDLKFVLRKHSKNLISVTLTKEGKSEEKINKWRELFNRFRRKHRN